MLNLQFIFIVYFPLPFIPSSFPSFLSSSLPCYLTCPGKPSWELRSVSFCSFPAFCTLRFHFAHTDQCRGGWGGWWWWWGWGGGGGGGGGGKARGKSSDKARRLWVGVALFSAPPPLPNPKLKGHFAKKKKSSHNLRGTMRSLKQSYDSGFHCTAWEGFTIIIMIFFFFKKKVDPWIFPHAPPAEQTLDWLVKRNRHFLSVS